MQFRSLGREGPVEEETTSHSSVLAWEIPRDGGARRAAVHGVVKESDTGEQLSTRRNRTLRWRREMQAGMTSDEWWAWQPAETR